MQKTSWRDWYYLTKPGIIYGNGIHFIAGFLLASKNGLDVSAGLYGLVGTSLLIASACVVNNYFDRDIDAKMKRTKKRASVTGQIPLRYSAPYALALAALGITVLILENLWLVLWLGLIAYILYTTVYTYAKRVTVHSTLIGSIPGAIPAMAGFVTPSGALSTGAWAVFALIATWQMPHFYAISLFRRSEYKKAGIPVMGVVAPAKNVITLMLIWAAAYALTIVVLIVNHVFSLLPGVILLGAAGYWIGNIAQGYNARDIEVWARQIFKQSLLLTLLFSLLAFVNLFV